jgi:hypothetical protein
MALRVPLRQDQIEAASKIRLRLHYWQEADSALRTLAKALPGFETDSTLLKVATINTLYGTNLYAFSRMAQHITNMLGHAPELTPALVEGLASLPAAKGQKARHHWSFASKFCHFFLSAEAFPIYDTWAQWTVRHHLGRDREVQPDRPYIAFVKNLRRLMQHAELSVSLSDLDGYLWIRGGWNLWRKRPDAPINGELKAFFTANERSRLLKCLVNENQ